MLLVEENHTGASTSTHTDNRMLYTEGDVRIQFTSPFGHNRMRMYARNQMQKMESNVETQNITWKTHNGGKNHDSPQAVKYTI